MKKIIAMLLAIVMLVSLAACGAKTEAPAPEAPKAETPAPAPEAPKAETPVAPAKPYEGVTINVLGNSSTDSSFMQAYLDEFTAETGIKVNYEQLTNDQLNTKITVSMAAGGAGDAIAGIYMEGPYMNPKFGAMPERNKWKGAIAEDAYKEVVDTAGTDAFVWSVAPEREGIEEFVKYAGQVNPHAVFAVGHSEATPTQVRKMKRYGLRIQTHCMDATGNYSEWVGTRGAGPDEACLTDPDMYAELICDSGAVHVNKDLINLIVRTKGVDKVILITDSFVSDLPAPEKLKHITDLIFDENCWLSGSKLTMNVACRNIMSHTNCGIAQAFLMASRNPARAIGLDDEIGTIEEGKLANLVFVDDVFNVKKVILGGKVWEA